MRNHNVYVINVTPRDDQPDQWHVVCTHCAHDWRRTNAADFGEFKTREGADQYAFVHNIELVEIPA